MSKYGLAEMNTDELNGELCKVLSAVLDDYEGDSAGLINYGENRVKDLLSELRSRMPPPKSPYLREWAGQWVTNRDYDKSRGHSMALVINDIPSGMTMHDLIKGVSALSPGIIFVDAGGKEAMALQYLQQQGFPAVALQKV